MNYYILTVCCLLYRVTLLCYIQPVVLTGFLPATCSWTRQAPVPYWSNVDALTRVWQFKADAV